MPYGATLATAYEPGLTKFAENSAKNLTMHLPDENTFAKLAIDHDFVPVFRRLLSDTLTPVTAFRLLDDGGPACLFESVIGGEKVGRYSFLASGPTERFSAKGKQIHWTTNLDSDDPQTSTRDADDPLDEFRGHFHYQVAEVDGLPPFIGGAIGYAGYDVVRYVENLPDHGIDDRFCPIWISRSITRYACLITLAKRSPW